MSRFVRNQRGNRRRGVFDKTIVPKNDYWNPHQVLRPRVEEPILDLGKPVKILNVHVHEISLTYEGNPKNPTINEHVIPFAEIVGNPISEETLETGYSFETVQGESLLVKWYQGTDWYQRGVVIHNLNASNHPGYLPNYGNIAAVGIEWQTEDGSESGLNWAYRIGGSTYCPDLTKTRDYSMTFNLYWAPMVYKCGEYVNGDPKYCRSWSIADRGQFYAPNAIRPDAMCGDPLDRTIGRLGSKLPIRSYPALGEVGHGLMFMFKNTITKFLEVEPEPTEPVDPPEPTPTPTTSPTPTYPDPTFDLKDNVVLFTTEPIGEYLFSATADNYSSGNKNPGDDVLTGYQEFGEGEHPFSDGQFNSSIRSNCETIYVPPGMTLELYPLPNFEGTPYIVTGGKLLLAHPLRIDNATDENRWMTGHLGAWQEVLKPEIREIYYVHGTGDTWWEQAGRVDNVVFWNTYIRDGSFKVIGTGQGGDNQVDTALSFFCDGSVEPSTVNTDYWAGDRAWNAFTQQVVTNDLGEPLDSKFWEARNQLLELFNNANTPVANSIESISDFHLLLWNAITLAKSGALSIPTNTWEEFDTWCDDNLSCVTGVRRGMIYFSVKTKIPTIFKSSAQGYLEGSTPDIMAEYISKLPRNPVDWLDFNDVKQDPAGSLIGAFAADMYNESYPDLLENFSSFINFEPSALLYGEGAAIASNPHDYVKPMSTSWGTPVAHSVVNYAPYTTADFVAGDTAARNAIVAAEVAIHEFGHSVDYYNRQKNGVLFSAREDWLSIGGWGEHFGNTDDTSKHLIKDQTAAETGGMPKTNSGKEPAISDYGCMSPMEDFAEAFRVYIFNPNFLRDKFPQRYAFMETHVRPLI